MQETPVQSLGQEDPTEVGANSNPLQYSCLGISHGYRSLEGCKNYFTVAVKSMELLQSSKHID